MESIDPDHVQQIVQVSVSCPYDQQQHVDFQYIQNQALNNVYTVCVSDQPASTNTITTNTAIAQRNAINNGVEQNNAIIYDIPLRILNCHSPEVAENQNQAQGLSGDLLNHIQLSKGEHRYSFNCIRIKDNAVAASGQKLSQQPTQDISHSAELFKNVNNTVSTKEVPITQESMHECNVCGKLYKRKTELLKHTREKHAHDDSGKIFIDSDSYVCSKCDEIIQSRIEHKHKMVEHNKSDTTSYNVCPCPVCHKLFASKDSWLAHLQSGIHDKFKYICLICSDSFTSTYQLIEHVSTHKPERKYKCSKCPQKFIYSVSLKRHLDGHNSKRAINSTKNYEPSPSEHASIDSDDAEEPFKLSKPGKSSPFWCDICGLKYAYRQGLRKHQRKVHGSLQSFSEPRPCSKCNKTFIKVWYLNEHEKYCDGMQKVKSPTEIPKEEDSKCPICNQLFANRKRMLSHKRDSHRPKLVCDICGHTFTRRTSLRKHVRHSHEGRRDFICGKCGKQFTTASSLQRHERLHLEARPFKCQCCDRAYSTSYLLILHNEIHIDEKDKNFQCERCALRFSRLLTLKHHSKRNCERRITSARSTSGSHHGKMTAHTLFPCTMCKRRFKSETVLARHIRFMHNDDSSLTCQICGLIFRTLPCFRKHQALHNGALHRCRYCQKTFMSKNTMVIHERRQHTGETPYPCTVCGLAFVTERRLIAHQLVHVGKEIKCDYCQALFASNHEKEKHMRRHTGEKPHVCFMCARGFSTKRLLESHLRTHTGDRPFSCNICSARYAEARGLKNHLLARHPNRAPPLQDDNGTADIIQVAAQLDQAPQQQYDPGDMSIPRIYDDQLSLPTASHSETMLIFQKI